MYVLAQIISVCTDRDRILLLIYEFSDFLYQFVLN